MLYLSLMFAAEMLGVNDDCHSHRYEAYESDTRADDYSSGAENVRIEIVDCRAASEHEYETEDYQNSGCCHGHEVGFLQRHVLAAFYVFVFIGNSCVVCLFHFRKMSSYEELRCLLMAKVAVRAHRMPPAATRTVKRSAIEVHGREEATMGSKDDA